MLGYEGALSFNDLVDTIIRMEISLNIREGGNRSVCSSTAKYKVDGVNKI